MAEWARKIEKEFLTNVFFLKKIFQSFPTPAAPTAPRGIPSAKCWDKWAPEKYSFPQIPYKSIFFIFFPFFKWIQAEVGCYVQGECPGSTLAVAILLFLLFKNQFRQSEYRQRPLRTSPTPSPASDSARRRPRSAHTSPTTTTECGHTELSLWNQKKYFCIFPLLFPDLLLLLQLPRIHRGILLGLHLGRGRLHRPERRGWNTYFVDWDGLHSKKFMS